MPWRVEENNAECDGYAVVVSEGDKAGEVVGCHESRASAEAQQSALYANTEYRFVRVTDGEL